MTAHPAREAAVVVTVRNEAAGISALLESLVPQQGLAEVVVVDALSTDGTATLAESFAGRLPLRVLRRACRRGEGRNVGVEATSAPLVAFTDGDCTADPGWLAALLAAWDGEPDRVVAGRTLYTGRASFARLHRVELPHRGQDTTWPSCNLAYPRALLRRLGGFDPSFVTAEDIDLNYRAVSAGARIVHEPGAVVHARSRPSFGAFLRQAYWNGYGRKQLTRKHGRLWKDYSLRQLAHLEDPSPMAFVRMAAGFVGYLDAKLGRPPSQR
jgi:glycosyltransferase involved in cell wall biosynthesis